MAKRVLYSTLGVAACIALILVSVSHVVAQTAEGGYKIFRPEGPGPHPAVVFLSGCSGFTPSFAPKHYELVAEQFRTKGYVVVFADYLGRRGLTDCFGFGASDAAGDLVAAATWLKSQPFIDAARITAIGWSFGGGAVLAALSEYKIERLIFTRAIVYYPMCMDPPSKVPVLMLLGEEDDVVRNKSCQEVAKKSDIPEAVKIVIYPGAHHGFDMSELPPKRGYAFGTLGYHPQAAAAAWEEVQRFLQPTK
jgi:dienelactone hydrolase